MLPDVRTATPADRDAVVATVVAAFVADPAFRYFFPDPATYETQAAAFAGYLFDKRVRHDTVWVVADGAAVSMWNPPSAAEHAQPPPLDVPAGTQARIDTYEAAAHTVLPVLSEDPHWYLGVLATHPAQAGQRWGRLVMAAGLERAAADGLPAYLETTSASNVALYERSGWTVTATVPVATLDVRILRHP
jgi:ribosomal protein S18 acetylase RimI-like enzyme